MCECNGTSDHIIVKRLLLQLRHSCLRFLMCGFDVDVQCKTVPVLIHNVIHGHLDEYEKRVGYVQALLYVLIIL